MEEKKEIYGNLFGTIEILSEEHLEIMLSSMDKDSATYFVVEALKAAHKRGAFTIGEVEVISKAIRSISRND
jgi:20S proteasome alpha/beta subunit